MSEERGKLLMGKKKKEKRPAESLIFEEKKNIVNGQVIPFGMVKPNKSHFLDFASIFWPTHLEWSSTVAHSTLSQQSPSAQRFSSGNKKNIITEIILTVP